MDQSGDGEKEKIKLSLCKYTAAITTIHLHRLFTYLNIRIYVASIDKYHNISSQYATHKICGQGVGGGEHKSSKRRDRAGTLLD